MTRIYLVKPNVKTLGICLANNFVVILLILAASHIHSASHVIKMVQVKPEMKMKVNHRFDCQHDLIGRTSLSRWVNFQGRLFPETSQCGHIEICLREHLDLGLLG